MPSPYPDNLSTRAESLLAESKLLANPYFGDLRAGTLSRDAFRRSQEQFLFAVRFFSRPMGALVARLPDSASRMDLVRNLAEEQGDFVADAAHDSTFRAFLLAIGGTSEQLVDVRESPGVCAFNQALMGTCLVSSLPFAVASIGIIEYAFADVSAMIGQAVIANGWADSGHLPHYKLHAEIDKRHASEFFELIDRNWPGESAALQVDDGLRFGLHLFNQLYNDLYDLL